MEIIRMSLENFQGIKNFVLDAGGINACIYGDNGTGKSTIYNAFTWLMYGKASTDEKNYTPKTVGSHHLNHIVEITMRLDDGSRAVFKKDFHEVYKTKRGNADPVFAGHTSDYSIDGVPVSEGEFSERLKGIYKSEEIAKMLTSYSYFLEEMKVKDRRNRLLEICGDIDFDTVISLNDDLKELPIILKKDGDTDSLYSVEEYQAIAAKEKKLIDKKLKEIPGRIDEVEKAKPDVGGEDRAGIKAEIELLNRKKAEIELRSNKTEAEKDSELRTALAEAKAAYSKSETEYLLTESKRNDGVLDEIRTLQQNASGAEDTINAFIKKKKERLDNAKAMTECRERLMKQWTEESAKKWEGDGICPTCGQPLPEEQIKKAKEEFNIQKSKTLEDIQRRGQTVSKDSIAEEQKKADELTEQIEEMKKKLLDLRALITEKKASIVEIVPFRETTEGSGLAVKIEVLKKELDASRELSEHTADPDKEQLKEIDERIAEANSRLANIALAEKQDERKRELEDEEQELSQKYEVISKGIYLCDLFSKTKAEALDDKVNSHFKTLKFRLFTEQLNGGIADDCEALIPCGEADIPFKSANNASRINAGLEMIDALGAFYNVSLPVFVDNAESSTNIRKTKAQQIRLYVSEKDKELRTENDLPFK